VFIDREKARHRFRAEKKMKVLVPSSVTTAIRTLSAEESQKVFSWLDHLKNWENDEHLQSISKPMIYKNTYVLNTSDDIRIFFTLESKKKTITIVDIAKPSRFETAGAQSE